MAPWLRYAAVGAGVTAASVGGAGTLTITALQWNPHWECFEQSAECKSRVVEALPGRLANGTDFANVVELEADGVALPEGWENITSACRRDVTVLFFNAARWRRASIAGAGERGCMVPDDRPYVVQLFEHRTEDLKLVVVGAHFPHRQLGSALGEAIQRVVNSTGVDATLLIADTNINRPSAWPLCPASLCASSADLMKALGVARAAEVLATDLLKTCCLNPPYGFAFEFDRVIANFGTAMTTELHDDPAPGWAVGAFHKGVTARLTVPISNSAVAMRTAEEVLVA